MKAKVIATGEVIYVEKHTFDYALGAHTYKDVNSDAIYTLYDLEFGYEKTKSNACTTQKNINWEQRRFELIKAALPAIVSISSENSEAMQSLVSASLFGEKVSKEKLEQIAEKQITGAAQSAIKYADAVIAKLKEE